MRYFCQADVDNVPYENSLFRIRTENNLIYEEFWNQYSQLWEPTSELSKLRTGGDCSTLEITEESALLIILNSQK
jgi:hypothetical protein